MHRPIFLLAAVLAFGPVALAPVVLAPAAAAATTAPGANAVARPDDAEVARFAQAYVARNYPADGPGAAVLVARGDRVIWSGARGLDDIGAGTPLTDRSVFRIGSVTKQMAAAGLLKLVEAGKVGLDDPLSKYLPGYPGGDRITVLMLLNHTSGVRSYTGIPGYMADGIRRDLTTAQLVEVFRDQPVDFAPGADWSYNNSGYVLLGAVIEAASGKPWHVHLKETLFRPLGMTHTGYGHDPAVAARQVTGYTWDGKKIVPMAPLSMTQPHAAGALVSTVGDLLIWNRALHEGRVLSDPLYARMITPEGAAAKAGYGFGIGPGTVRGAPALSHTGGIFGFSSVLYYAPGEDITVAVLENDDEDNGPESADAVARRLLAAALGRPYPELTPVPVDAATLKAAEGVYRFDGDIVRVLRVTDGKLTAQRGAQRPAQLTPIGPDNFLYADGFNRLELVRNDAGEIAAMRFFAEGEGDGVVGARTAEPLPAAPVGVVLPQAALERVAGDYAGGGLNLKIVLDGATAVAELVGQPPVRLRAASPTLFHVEGVEATLEFGGGDAPAAQVILRQGGRELVLSRTP